MLTNGADIEFWFDGVECPVQSANIGSQFDTVESTDSATPGTGKDFEPIRAARTLSVEAELYEADGTELSSGDLTAGVRYKVTKGSVAETQGTFTLGMVFESDGTGEATADNCVKPLGARINGKDMAISFGGVEAPVTDVEYSVKFDEVDVTDSSTAGDAKAVEVTRADREIKTTAILRAESADLLTTAPAAQSFLLNLGTGASLSGKAVLTSKNITASNSEFAKIEYSGKVNGFPTETNFGLPAGQKKAFKLILKRGTSTNKEYTGTAIITSKTIKANISSMATISYTLTVDGALTENVAN